MASGSGTLTSDGRDVFLELMAGESTGNPAVAIALGSAEGTAYWQDQELKQEDYRFAIDRIETLDDHTKRFEIDTIGGTNVEAGYEAKEFGLFTDTADNSGRLIYHKFTDGTVVNKGVEQTFVVELDLKDVST